MNFECAVEPRGNVTRFKLVLDDLIAERPVTRESVDSIVLLSRGSEGKYTYINPVNRTNQFISVFWKPDSGLNGFWVKEHSCFEKFENLVSEILPAQFKISLFSAP